MEKNNNIEIQQQNRYQEGFQINDLNLDEIQKKSEAQKNFQFNESEIQSQEGQSEDQKLYYKYLQQKNVNISKDRKDQLFRLLKDSQITVNLSQSQFSNCDLVFESIQTQQNVKIFTVRLGPFRQKINILVENRKSLFHHKKNYQKGAYGTVYPIIAGSQKKQECRVKCIKLPLNKPDLFKYHVREYFFANLLSVLKIGPKIVKIFGFDMVIWQDCIEFTMEKCTEIEQIYRDSENENEIFCLLAKKLYSLHLLNIVHLDIKLPNIMFSQSLKQPIFIDFGCTKIIPQKIGSLSISDFFGTYNESSPQMKKIFLNGKGKVDLYYNDMHALQYSQQKFLSLRHSQIKKQQNQQQQPLDQNNSKKLDILLLRFKYLVHNRYITQFQQTLKPLLDSERHVLQILLYLRQIKPTFEVRNCFEKIYPFLCKLKDQYGQKKFKMVNIQTQTKNQFKNVFELIEYLEKAFLRFPTFFMETGYQNPQNSQQLQNFISQFQSLYKTSSQPQILYIPVKSHKQNQSQKDFEQFYTNFCQKINVLELVRILKSREMIIKLPMENYFAMFLYCLDFTKNLGIDLNDKLIFATIFYELYCHIGSNIVDDPQITNDIFNEIKLCLKVLIEYCTSNQLTSFKVIFFSKICTQLLLVHSVNIILYLPIFSHFFQLWFNLLASENKIPMILKYNEVYKSLETCFIIQVTDMNIYNFQNVNRVILINFFKKLKQNYKDLTKEELIVSQYFEWLILNLQKVDMNPQKIKKMNQSLEKNLLLPPRLKRYLTKVMEINGCATEIIINQMKNPEKLQYFEEILQNFYKELTENKDKLNNEHQIFIFRIKTFKLAWRQFQYNKALTIIKSIECQVNCREITDKMFTVQKVQMNDKMAFVRTYTILSRLDRMRQNRKMLINPDYIHELMEILKNKIYYPLLVKQKSIPKHPYKLLQSFFCGFLRIKTKHYVKKFNEENKAHYYWLETLQLFTDMTFFYPGFSYYYYKMYFDCVKKKHITPLFQARFKYLTIKRQQQKCQNPQQVLPIADKYESEVLGFIDKFLFERNQQNRFKLTQICEMNKQKRQNHSDTEFAFSRISRYVHPYKEPQGLINIYFLTVIRISQIALKTGHAKIRNNACLRLAQLANNYHHYVSFFEGYSIIYHVLMALSIHFIEFTPQYMDLNALQKDFGFGIDKNIQLKQIKDTLWNFIFNVSMFLTKIIETNNDKTFLSQITTYFQALKVNFKIKENLEIQSNELLGTSDSIIINTKIKELSKWLFTKIIEIDSITLQKHNGLVLFLIFSIWLKKSISKFDIAKEKKHLWKATKCLEFLRPVFKETILGKYYEIMDSELANKHGFQRYLLIQKSKINRQVTQTFCQKIFKKKKYQGKLYEKLEKILFRKLKIIENNSN